MAFDGKNGGLMGFSVVGNIEINTEDGKVVGVGVVTAIKGTTLGAPLGDSDTI